MKPIGLASDHAGFELKSFVCRYLDERGIPYVDFGTHSSDSCDYPDFGHALGRASMEKSANAVLQFVAAAKASP